MLWPPLVHLLLLLLLLPVAGCLGSDDSDDELVSLTGVDAGRTIPLVVGQELAISLEGNPTTGYSWEVAELDQAIVRPVGDAEFKPASPAIGSGGTVALRFAAMARGETALRLVYRRPWEQGVAPLQSFALTIRVS